MTTDTEILDGFKLSMSRLAAGVTIVASASGDQMQGMAATSPSSVSMDPPTLLVCLDKGSRTYGAVEASRRFCVSLLAVDQTDALNAFAGRLDGVADEERFNHVAHSLTDHGQPRIDNAISWIDCEVDAIHPGGESHAIVVGRVVGIGHDRPDAHPMVWYGRAAGTYAEQA